MVKRQEQEQTRKVPLTEDTEKRFIKKGFYEEDGPDCHMMIKEIGKSNKPDALNQNTANADSDK